MTAPLTKSPRLTLAQIRRLHPCKPSYKLASKALRKIHSANTGYTAKDAKKAGVSFDDLVWVAEAVAKENKDVERRLRLWAADCAAHVLHIYEKLESDDRPRKAVEAVRAYARGETDAAAWDAAWYTARNVEKQWQYDRLVAWLSDPEPEDWPLPKTP